MSVSAFLDRCSDRISMPETFRLIGSPGLLETNESTPQGFYDHVRETYAPDGYIYGPGCGNVLSMVEAFSSCPRGVVLVDMDPAVVLAARMVVTSLAHHERVEDFVAAFFGADRASLESLQEEALEDEASEAKRRQMEAHGERLWSALTELTGDFSGETGERLSRWAAYYPLRGGPVPVAALLVHNYAKLHRLAADGDIAVVLGSLLDPGLITLLTELPGFRESRNLVYLSNVADHLRRRALLADGRRCLMLASPYQPEGPAVRSGEELLDFLNREQLGRLETLAAASRSAVFVRATGIGRLTLEAHGSLPLYTAEDFGSALDLKRMIPHFLLSVSRFPEPPPSLEEGDLLHNPWQGARHHRQAVLALYAAWIAGDRARVRGGVEELLAAAPRAMAAPEDAPGLPFPLFWIAEVGYLLVLLGRHGGADGRELVEEGARRLEVAGAWLRRYRERWDTEEGVSPAPLLLAAQSFLVAGSLLEEDDLGQEGRELAAAGRKFLGEGAIAERSETLLRAVLLAVTMRDPRGLEGLEGLVHGLLEEIADNGSLKVPLESESPGRGYRGYLDDSQVVYENVRLGLLFYGLSTENADAIEAALMVDHYARHRNKTRVPEPDAVLGALGAK